MKPQIDYARIFRAAARMEDTGKARELLRVVAAAARQPDMKQLTDKDWAAHYAKRLADIEHLHRELKNELRLYQSAVLRNLRRHFANADIQSASAYDFLFDPAELAADLAEVLGGTLPDYLVDAGQDVLLSFEPAPDEAKAFITGRENLMTNVAQETFDSVKDELQQGLDKGESYRELAKRLSTKFDEINEGRAQVVASTEVASAYGYARNEAMKQSGATHKLWVGSGRPPGTLHGMRPTHAAAHYEGQTVAIDEPFRVGGALLMFPTDSSLGAGPELTINCHCVALPAEEPISSGDLPGHEFHGNQYTRGISMKKEDIKKQVDEAITQKNDWSIILPRKTRFSKHPIRFSIEHSSNPNITKPYFTVTALANQYGTQTFDYSVNKNYDSKEQFLAAIFRAKQQSEEIKGKTLFELHLEGRL